MTEKQTQVKSPRGRKKQKPGKRTRGKHAVKPPELAIWKMMIQRCRNPRHTGDKDYGTPISERWLGTDGFANFLADVGPQPFRGAGLRRRDLSIGFAPGNVEWGPTRGTILTYEGRSMSLADWAKSAIYPGTLRARHRMGWSVERMLTRGVRSQDPYFGRWAEHKRIMEAMASKSSSPVTS